MRRKGITFSCDFETTTDPNDCRVWAWAASDIAKFNFDYGTDIDGFMRFVVSQPDGSVFYFHNLKFDGSFIADWLLRAGYVWNKKLEKNNDFSSLIDGNSQWYSLSFMVNGCKYTFRDSLKKLPMGVSRIAEAFNLDISKGEIDYEAYREPGHTPTVEELDYLKRDVLIVAKALKQQFDSGLSKMTVGSDALTHFKKLQGDNFRHYFPELPKPTDDEIRKAYRGGFTYASPNYSHRLLGEGDTYDVNSLYPFVMKSYPIPVGQPTFRMSIPDGGSLFIASIVITADVKPEHIPCIQIKGSLYFGGIEYLEHISEPTQVYCTSVDLKLWEEHYNLVIHDVLGVWEFNSIRGIFDDYIDFWSEIKKNSDGGMRTLAKLQLNSLYGKLASRTESRYRVPVLVDDVLQLEVGGTDTRRSVYTPAGVFITAYARYYTISNAQKHYKYFAYADTDSLHLIGCDNPQLNIDSKELGAWKHEGHFSKAVFVRAKCYCETIDNVNHTHIAGLPHSLAKTVEPEDLLHELVLDGKFLPRRVPGGTVLESTTFTIK